MITIRAIKGDTRSLDNGSHNPYIPRPPYIAYRFIRIPHFALKKMLDMMFSSLKTWVGFRGLGIRVGFTGLGSPLLGGSGGLRK